MLLKHLEDWALYEQREGKPFERVLYTNLPLQSEPINDYISSRIGEQVDVSHYILPIDEDVRQSFINDKGKFPLATLRNNSLIVIDEVQKMFGAEMDTDKKHKQFDVEFRNYVSQHRHYGHDLIFITQHTDNISKAILSQAEKCFSVENAKHHGLPFPFNIPFADLDVVKEAFGFKQQFYRVSVGKYQSRRVRYDGETTSHLMLHEVFACYQSHTLSDVTSDRPSLNLSRFGAIKWLAKRHGWHLSIKLFAAIVIAYTGISVLFQMPTILSNGVAAGLGNAGAAVTSPLTDQSDNVTIPRMSPSIPDHAPPVYSSTTPMYSRQYPGGQPPVSAVVGGCNDPHCTGDHGAPAKPQKDEKITAVFAQGVITDNGRRRIGQPVMIDGEQQVIKGLNVRDGVVLFESGKSVTVPK